MKRAARRREYRGAEGFTLIELLIVIVVLGILAAIVVFALGDVTQQSAVAACNSDAKTVSVAVSAYETNNSGHAPTSVASLVSPPAGITGGPFLKTAPSNSDYSILLDANGNVLVSFELNVASSVTGTSGAAPSGTSPAAPGGSTWLNGGNGSATSATSIGGTAETYEGGTAFSWSGPSSGTAAGSGNTVPATDWGQNVCAGA